MLRCRNGKWLLLGMAILLLLTSLLAACAKEEGAAPTPTIKIGIIGPMMFATGMANWQGAVLAAEEINAAGGVNVGGVMHQIELVQADSNEYMSTTDATAAMERLITVDKVDFTIGGVKTEALLGMQEVMADNKILHIVPMAGGAPQLCERVAENYERYKYFFRMQTDDAYYGSLIFGLVNIMATAIRAELDIAKPKVAVLMERSLWADPIIKAAPQVLAGLGCEVVGTWRISMTATDVTAEMTAIKAAGAHIIFSGTSGPNGAAVSIAWGELEVPAAMGGISGIGMEKGYWATTGGMCNYEAFPQSVTRVHITDRTIPFWDSYEERWGEWPMYPACSYDSMYVLKGAIERAGTLDDDAVVVEMEKTDYAGAFGRWVFQLLGDAYPHSAKCGPEYYTNLLVQWQDGDMVAIWPDGKAFLGDTSWVGVRYEGTKDYVLPPWMVEYWKP